MSCGLARIVDRAGKRFRELIEKNLAQQVRSDEELAGLLQVPMQTISAWRGGHECPPPAQFAAIFNRLTGALLAQNSHPGAITAADSPRVSE